MISSIASYKLKGLGKELLILINANDNKAASFYLNFCCMSEVIYEFLTFIKKQKNLAPWCNWIFEKAADDTSTMYASDTVLETDINPFNILQQPWETALLPHL